MLVSLLGILTLLVTIMSKVNGETNDITKNSLNNQKILFDFTNGTLTNDWIEQSDTVREVGMSKAIFTLQKTQVFSRAVLFTLLNPQINGACFAGVRLLKSYNMHLYNKLLLKLRAQGENKNYKIILRHKGLNEEPNPTYEQFFTAPYEQFDLVSLPLDQFKPYYRGKPVDAEPLDTSKITSFGIQIYGGVYLEKKQKGTSSLEIDWVKLEM